MPLTLEAEEPSRVVRMREKVRRGLPRTGLAAVCGAVMALSFPSVGIWPLSVLAVAALSLLTFGRTARQGAWTGLVFGLVFMLWLLFWIGVIGYDAWALLSVAEAAFLALLGAGLAVVSRLPFWPLWTACLWVTQEWARDRVPLGGFPWGRLAFANTDSPFTPLAALGGAPLVSFAVALCGALLAAVVLKLRTAEGRASGGRLAVACGVGAVVAGVVGYAIPLPTAGTTAGGPADAQIGVIQGNVPHAGMDFLGRPMQVLENHVQATEKLMAKVDAGQLPRPQIVIWPENSSDVNPYTVPEAYYAIQGAAQSTGVPMLVGALVDGPDAQHVLNEGIVWDPKTGPGAHYTKQHPVPFGEYVPFRSILMKFITRLQRVARDFYPGDRTGVLQVGPVRLGDVICFEVAYDGIVHDAVAKGGRVLVVQTNNATYEHTDQPDQQFAMSRLRAIEHGRAVVIAATSGISAVIAPDGSVVERTQLATQAELDVKVPLRDGLTLADRLGAGPEWALALIGLGALGWGAVRTRRRGSSGKSGGSGQPGQPGKSGKPGKSEESGKSEEPGRSEEPAQSTEASGTPA